jgi:DNA-binding transcriptional LysR family regulator
MRNIPTELLRTFVTVVELRSFTRAAQLLGITQPAVSTQVKRLGFMLGGDLFDKSAPGVVLTERGEMVANLARRMLVLNDQMLDLAVPRPTVPAVRLGIPGDFCAATLPTALVAFRAQFPGLRFQVRGDVSENLLRDLRQGRLDLAVALSVAGPGLDARHYWEEDVLWVRSAKNGPIRDPVPLATYGEGFILHRMATSVLNQVGREYELVYTVFSLVGLIAAVAAGLGVTLLPRRSITSDLVEWENGPLAKSLRIYCGVYPREGADRQVLALADAIADALRPQAAITPKTPTTTPLPASAEVVAPLLHAGESS